MTPQLRPCSEKRLVDSARPQSAMVVDSVPLWIFENLDEDSELSNEEEEVNNAEASAELTADGSSTQPNPGQNTAQEAARPQNQSEADARPNGVPLSVHESVSTEGPRVVDGVDLRIFDLQSEDSDWTDDENEAFCSRPTVLHKKPASSSHRDSVNGIDADSVNTSVENVTILQNVVCSPAPQETSNEVQTGVANGSNRTFSSSNPASVHATTSISQKSTNSTGSHIPTAMFDTFDGDSDTTDEISEDPICSPYDPIFLNNIKLETVCSDNETDCTSRACTELANDADDDRSRLPAKQMKLHTNEDVVQQQISNVLPVTRENSQGSCDLFSSSTPDDDPQQLDVAESQPTGTSVEPPPAQHSILNNGTTNESPIGRLQSNAGEFLRSTIEAKIQLHESLRSMLPGLFAKQPAESVRSDPLPLIEQKLSLLRLVAAGLKRSYCRDADLGCIVSIAAQLAYGDPDAACLLWRS